MVANNSIRIRKTIDSDTLHLPELNRFIGHTVDIVIEERSAEEVLPANVLPANVLPGTGDWDTVLSASQKLQDYDYGAQFDQDARDIRDAQDRLR